MQTARREGAIGNELRTCAGLAAPIMPRHEVDDLDRLDCLDDSRADVALPSPLSIAPEGQSEATLDAGGPGQACCGSGNVVGLGA